MVINMPSWLQSHERKFRRFNRIDATWLDLYVAITSPVEMYSSALLELWTFFLVLRVNYEKTIELQCTSKVNIKKNEQFLSFWSFRWKLRNSMQCHAIQFSRNPNNRSVEEWSLVVHTLYDLLSLAFLWMEITTGCVPGWSSFMHGFVEV